jgi:hypothetical protein
VPDRSLTIELILTLLAENPRRIASLTDGLAPAQLRTAPNQDGWSANDVRAHLRACAARRLVTCRNSDGSGSAARTDRAHVCAVAGSPRTDARQADSRHREHTPHVGGAVAATSGSEACQRGELYVTAQPPDNGRPSTGSDEQHCARRSTCNPRVAGRNGHLHAHRCRREYTTLAAVPRVDARVRCAT